MKIYIQTKSPESAIPWEQIKRGIARVEKKEDATIFGKVLASYLKSNVRITHEHKEGNGHYFAP